MCQEYHDTKVLFIKNVCIQNENNMVVSSMPIMSASVDVCNVIIVDGGLPEK